MATLTPTLPIIEDEIRIKKQPPYAVIVINDDIHTFEYVINCFQKVFGYNLQKSGQLAMRIHTEGRAIVWTGSLEVAELKKNQIEGMGPDHKALKKCDFPLGVELEPLC